jgi:hypothetical protein
MVAFQGKRIAGQFFIYSKLSSVEFIQTIFGSDPDKTFFILVNPVDQTAGKSLFGGIKFSSLCKNRSPTKNKKQTEETYS